MFKLVLGALLALSLSSLCWASKAPVPPNVLFIMVDDLRVELGAYGSKHAISPNIDRLAEQGTRFDNAYVSVPVCGASRASIITGMRALPERFVNYYTSVENDAPNATTIFETFKDKGYYTVGYGKIFHNVADTEAKSWSDEKAWTPAMDQTAELNTGHGDYQIAENVALYRKTGLGPATEIFVGPDSAYFDGKLTDKALGSLASLANTSQPFFMALGYVKPHLPFNAPKKYWDMYSRDQFDLPEHNMLPLDAPIQAYHEFGELRDYSDTPGRLAQDEKFKFNPKARAFQQENPNPVSDELARRLIHGYHASVSYVDALIGRVLAQVEDLGLSENTIIVLMGDHGYILGEHGLWCKHSTFDVATKTPLIIRAPNMPAKGEVDGLVEFIDIFPTLTELAGIDTPSQVAGISLAKLLADPTLPGRSAVFPRYHTAEAVRTDNYTLTQWFDEGGNVAEQMLYDNVKDPNETRNLVYTPKYSPVLKDLSGRIAAHREARK